MARSHQELIYYANDEILAKGNEDVVDEVFAEDYVVHSGDGDYEGQDFVRRFIRQLRQAIPDLEIRGIEIRAQTRNTVTWQRTLRGTHENPLRGIPASGQKVEWHDMLVSRFEEGQIVEEWAVSELAGRLMSKLSRR